MTSVRPRHRIERHVSGTQCNRLELGAPDQCTGRATQCNASIRRDRSACVHLFAARLACLCTQEHIILAGGARGLVSPPRADPTETGAKESERKAGLTRVVQAESQGSSSQTQQVRPSNSAPTANGRTHDQKHEQCGCPVLCDRLSLPHLSCHSSSQPARSSSWA